MRASLHFAESVLEADLLAVGGRGAKGAPLSLAIKRQVKEKQIAYGEVYVPNDLDTQAEFMTEDDIELMAHRFLSKKLNGHIDLMHDNRPGRAMVVESFIARKGDPDFVPGSWVLGVHIPDRFLWDAVKKREITGFSFQARVRKQTVEVDLDDAMGIEGRTSPSGTVHGDMHTHSFAVKIDGAGNVVSGFTDEVDGHRHFITENVRTSEVNGHRHVFDMARAIKRFESGTRVRKSAAVEDECECAMCRAGHECPCDGEAA